MLQQAFIPWVSLLTIPGYYGEEVGLDLVLIAERSGLSIAEVIECHCAKIYDVYAIGFSPGFAYLGEVDDAIACPRKVTPRKSLPKGSVGIADQQTAVYPKDSPGGWQIVGRTPVELVDFQAEKITPFTVGGRVKFEPIDREQFVTLGGQLP